MNYSVLWKVRAIEQLNGITASAEIPERIRDAASRVDYTLRRMPRDLGESREPGFRLWFEDVLGVYYRIDEDAVSVEV